MGLNVFSEDSLSPARRAIASQRFRYRPGGDAAAIICSVKLAHRTSPAFQQPTEKQRRCRNPPSFHLGTSKTPVTRARASRPHPRSGNRSLRRTTRSEHGDPNNAQTIPPRPRPHHTAHTFGSELCGIAMAILRALDNAFRAMTDPNACCPTDQNSWFKFLQLPRAICGSSRKSVPAL
jgi:hypothetical protein